MIWKTDWRNTDDYAAEGVTDVQRLFSNYNALKAMLNDEHGFDISFVTPSTNGRRTMPFADFLNAIEAALNTLHVWDVEWEHKEITWQPAQTGPGHNDINRWERNGSAIETAAPKVKGAYVHCGTTYSGMGGIRV